MFRQSLPCPVQSPEKSKGSFRPLLPIEMLGQLNTSESHPTHNNSSQKKNKMKNKIVLLGSLLALSLGGGCAVIGCGGTDPNPPTPDPYSREDAAPAPSSTASAPPTPAMPEPFDAGTTK